jgi:hypothetical protein
MPFDCEPRRRFGPDFCLTSCPAASPGTAFQFARAEAPKDVPPPDAETVDVAVLDMHHGWPNLGHDAIIYAVQTIVCDMQEELAQTGLRVRAISYDVRRGLMVPEPPRGRHGLYVGTGGPAHLDPARNDGVSEGSQGITEDPSWEPRLFRLFDAIRTDPDAALFAVCHTFGVMCRWLGIAEAVLRGPDKGGKSTGIVEIVLTPEALAHPWFSRLAASAARQGRVLALDNRLYDLIPTAGPFPDGVVAIGYEAARDGERGEALTMVEVARDRRHVMPRIFGVNHHPEIVNRQRQITILRKKFERGTVARAWFEERMAALTQPVADPHGDRLLHLTSSYTLMAPVRFYIHRLVRERAESLGRRTRISESSAAITYDEVEEARTPVAAAPHPAPEA